MQMYKEHESNNCSTTSKFSLDIEKDKTNGNTIRTKKT
jgi:hypothetical protein